MIADRLLRSAIIWKPALRVVTSSVLLASECSQANSPRYCQVAVELQFVSPVRSSKEKSVVKEKTRRHSGKTSRHSQLRTFLFQPNVFFFNEQYKYR